MITFLSKASNHSFGFDVFFKLLDWLITKGLQFLPVLCAASPEFRKYIRTLKYLIFLERRKNLKQKNGLNLINKLAVFS